MTVLDPMIETKAALIHNALAQSAISAEEINDALDKMLASDVFRRARRMCRLLRYLVAQSMCGHTREMCEYAIGLEVFDRDPASYYPGEDPVVRVQVGRLRERLKEYYANKVLDVKIQFSIPLGNYCLQIQRRMNESSESSPQILIAFSPMQTISDDIAGRAFAKGLNEDLSYHLYRKFGSQLVSAAALLDMAKGRLANEYEQSGVLLAYILEGGIQVAHGGVKVNARLMDIYTHTIIWSEQYIENAGISLQLQEQFAARIGQDVKQYVTLASARGVS